LEIMAKLDPRVDPVTDPPSGVVDHSVERVAVPETTTTRAKSEPPSGVQPAEVEEVRALLRGEAPAPKKITSKDPRYEKLEKLLDVNDWRGIGAELGATEELGKLPPNLGLIAALAHNENAKEGDQEAVATAIRCMASLLGVDESSPVARVLARRMLRKNPVRLRDRKAPPARTSVLIVVLTLVVGGGVGWLASAGSWRAVAHMLHLM
jgi:hypothetical protein